MVGSFQPFVSVIVPAKNESLNIKKCIKSLVLQSYPKKRYEIIVVDNDSDDETGDIARSFDVNVFLFKGGPVGAVRNYGVKCSSGEILAFIDADCEASPYWIERAVALICSNANVVAVGGRPILRPNASWVERSWVLPQGDIPENLRSLCGASMFFRRIDYEKVSGFDDSINAGEDTRISYELKKSGGTILYSTDADVVHYGYPVTITSFFKRQFWQGSSFIRSFNGISDLVFVFSLVFLISSCLFVFFIYLDSYVLSLVSFFGIFLGPLLFSFKRILNSSKRISVPTLLGVFFLDCVYFLSRSLGLIYSVFSRKDIKRDKIK